MLHDKLLVDVVIYGVTGTGAVYDIVTGEDDTQAADFAAEETFEAHAAAFATALGEIAIKINKITM